MEKIINSFPGYEFIDGKNIYMGEDVGFGGYVYAEPGMYENVALLDIASQHPHSILAMNCFGEYTKKFKDLVNARIAIKHEDWDTASEMMDGKLVPYIEKVQQGNLTSKMLADALKIAINSVYGLTSASFDNPFRDPRNVNNIVALRGALFMITLKHEIQKRGFTVAHIKTDSIKIPNATPEIIQFVVDFGKKYGYNFEHEATYDRMCLVNDAVYIAKYQDSGKWTATGAQFQVPYVFKTLFSKEPIEFKDLCETKSVSKGEIYLDMNESLPDVSGYEKSLKKTKDDIKAGKIKMEEGSYNEYCQELEFEIAAGHDYHYVGKVGMFCPVVPDAGGGILYRKADNKYYAVTGTKGYRWLESEMVEKLGKQNDIDRSYYDRLVDEAVDTINKFGDYLIFTSDDQPPFEGGKVINLPESA